MSVRTPVAVVRRRAGIRRTIVGGLVVALAVGAFAALRSGRSEERRESVSPAQAVVDRSGVLPAQSSLPSRQRAAVSPLGQDRVFVFGGMSEDRDGGLVVRRDAYTIMLETGAVESVPESPLGPLWGPAAASNGGDVLVIGPKCAELVSEDEEEEGLYGCDDGDYVAARFHSRSRQWERIALPKELDEQFGSFPQGFGASTRAVSVSGAKRAAFALGHPPAARLLEYDFETDQASLAAPVRDVLDYCATAGSTLLALTSSDRNFGQIIDTNPQREFRPTQGGSHDRYVLPMVNVYDRDAGAWSAGVAEQTVAYEFEPRIACMGTGAGIIGRSMTDKDFAVYDLTTRRWTDAPEPPIPFGRGSVVWTGSKLVVLPDPWQADIEVPAFDPSANSFAIVTDVPWSTPDASWNGSEIVGYTGSTDALLWYSGGRDVGAVPSGTFRVPL